MPAFELQAPISRRRSHLNGARVGQLNVAVQRHRSDVAHIQRNNDPIAESIDFILNHGAQVNEPSNDDGAVIIVSVVNNISSSIESSFADQSISFDF